jgi:hypothetical protein
MHARRRRRRRNAVEDFLQGKEGLLLRDEEPAVDERGREELHKEDIIKEVQELAVLVEE